MASIRPIPRPMRIHCQNFAASEVDALRSLLNLLRDYLKHPWSIVDTDAADLVLVNLDVPGLGSEASHAGATRIGCALKPRMHAPGTIHRPLRAAEVLAVLTEARLRVQTGEQEAVEVDSVEWCYRLRHWPLEFSHWSRDTWPVMAAITRKHRSIREIEIRTRLSHKQVALTLALLKRMGLLDRLVERRASPRIDEQLVAGWQSLASRVGRLLGFAR
jgi:hypothetical protein